MLLLQHPGCGRLESRIGHEYAEVVLNCLTPEMTAGGRLTDDFENSAELQHDTQHDTLAKLKRLLHAV